MRMHLKVTFITVIVIFHGTVINPVLATIKGASKQYFEVDSVWFKPNITRRSGHHHHLHQHVNVAESASHASAAVVRAPPVVGPVSLSVPVPGVPTAVGPPPGVFAPNVVTLVRRPIVTSFFHNPPPPQLLAPSVVPVVHHVAAPPTPVPVYTTFISHAPQPVKPRTVQFHHHHHHHPPSKPLRSLPVVLDPVAYNQRYQNLVSDDEVIIRERDLAQLLQGKYTQFRGAWEPVERHLSSDGYRERKSSKYFYSGRKRSRSAPRSYRNSRKLHSRQREPEDPDDEPQGPNLGEKHYSSRDRGQRIDLSYAVRADRTLNGRNVVVIIPKK